MKNLKNILIIILAVAGLSSCVEEDPIFDTDKTANVVEIKSVGSAAVQSPIDAPHPAYIATFDVAPEAELPVTVSYSGAHVAPEDISVNLQVDPTLLDSYNEWDGGEEDHFTLIPEEWYTLPTTTVTIPKGEREVTFMVKVKPDLFLYDKTYALPVTITGASYGIISGNFNSAIIQVGAKNEWEGKYENTYDSSLGTGTNSVTLATTGQYSVKMLPGLIGVYSNEFFITVDPATNKVTVNMTTLLPVATDPSSHWDPETRTFYLKWTSNGGARQYEQTLVKQD